MTLPNSQQRKALYTKVKVESSVQVVSSHQELQTQLRRNLHIGHIGLVPVFLVVHEVFADFFEDDATAQG